MADRPTAKPISPNFSSYVGDLRFKATSIVTADDWPLMVTKALTARRLDAARDTLRWRSSSALVLVERQQMLAVELARRFPLAKLACLARVADPRAADRDQLELAAR